MNKRLKELERECWDHQTNHLNAEKFAELIVQECANACLNEGAKWRGEQDITDFKLCAHFIKEHFGVER